MKSQTLNNKKILVGITGGIAAYKMCSLIRLLVKSQAEVKVICTPDAFHFVTKLTLATLSKHKVYVDFYDASTGVWENHVNLGKWADAMLIAPATANTLAKMATGIADNLLLTTYLSADCPIFFAPAMDLDMYTHPTTVSNIAKLRSFGNIEIKATSGELASGLIGEGRMAEPETMIETLNNFFIKSLSLANKIILINAGPTHEHLDPVRFIGNHSSGKMGIAIANEAANRGARVELVLGPVAQDQSIHSSIKVTNVSSAEEMYTACNERFEYCDWAIFAAAVADYRPIFKATQKIKKNESTLTLALEKTTDILHTLGHKKNQNQRVVGFALETNDAIENGLKKLHNKNADLIVLNSMADKGAGFSGDTNKITLLTKNAEPKVFDLKSKIEVAADILNFMEQNL